MSETIYSCSPDEIVITEKRQRRDYKMDELKRLEASISKHGQLQPGVCRKEGNRVILVAGWRRLQACKVLEIPYQYRLLEEISDPVIREEMELHENLCRENLSFLDESAARNRLHKLYMETRGQGTIKGQPSWSIEKTAQELGISKSSLRNDIEIDDFAQAVPAVAESKTRSEAMKTVKRLKNQVLQQEAIRQLQKTEPKECTQEEKDEKQTLEDELSCAVQEFSKHIMCGEFIPILQERFEPETFDIVFFDPPWGVNFQDVFQLTGAQKGYSDKRKDFFANINQWLTTLYQYMKPDSILFLKFGITSHFWTVRTILRSGFYTNGIPIIWRKTDSHRTRSPERSFGRCYEPILLCHKGSKPIQLMGRQDYVETPSPTVKMKDIHPSTMHPRVPYELIQRVAFPGDHILDPMAGSGMTGVACQALYEQLRLNYTLIDKDQSYCNLMIKNLLSGYQNIVDAPPDQEPTTDFTTLEPGSPEWIKYWETHPDQHESMMSFMKNGGKKI